MAIIMNQASGLKTIGDIFGPSAQESKKLQYLIDKGANVKVGLFSFSITLAENTFSEVMPIQILKYFDASTVLEDLVRSKLKKVIEQSLVVSASSVAQIHIPHVSPEPEDVEQIKPALEPVTPMSTPAWMNAIPPTDKEIKAANTAKGIEVAKAMIKPKLATDGIPSKYESIPEQYQNEPVAKTEKTKPKLLNGVIALADARALSQQVHGTSGGSIYRVAAVGKVNIAMREQGGTISLRAEFQKKADAGTVAKLAQMGFSSKGDYHSLHINLSSSAPAMRVLGSVLIGAGIEFDEIATTKEQING